MKYNAVLKSLMLEIELQALCVDIVRGVYNRFRSDLDLYMNWFYLSFQAHQQRASHEEIQEERDAKHVLDAKHWSSLFLL